MLCAIETADTAHAQGAGDCRLPQPPSVGIAVGKSSPYLELPADVVEDDGGSGSVHAGTHVAGRADLPLVGPLRLRIEGATARWDVRRTRYDPGAGYRVTDDRSIGSMSARHLVALIGIRTGWPPVCARVSAGGGLYTIAYRNAALHRPGVSLSAGIEAPAGPHGVIQADAVLHVIRTGDGYPITSFADVPTLSLLVGWAYRF